MIVRSVENLATDLKVVGDCDASGYRDGIDGALYFWTQYGGGYFARCGASANRPVLAASIQVGAPNSERQEDVTRFTLTSPEAGLNDGLAFPFVYLAIAIATAVSLNQGFGVED
ncbi:MAG: hypothetical protein U1E91_05545 [Moraxella sp.]